MLALIDFTLSLGDLIVGIGTLALAFVTWQLVKATAASVEALDLPFLIAAPDFEGAFNYRPDDPTADDPDFDWALSVAVTNLGSGPAILDGIQMHSKTESKSLLKEGWNVDRPVLPEEKDLNIGVPLELMLEGRSSAPLCSKSSTALRPAYVTSPSMKWSRSATWGLGASGSNDGLSARYDNKLCAGCSNDRDKRIGASRFGV